jgi:rare lipoprotein A (peptidoglycan hydrolase)
MGRGSCSSRIACIGVLALSAAMLAACMTTNNSNYSPRVVEEGEPVPKGGGDFKVGQPYQQNGRIFFPSENPHYRAEGMASWYGRDFHGRVTANGEVYDLHAISGAHPTLPLPSYLRVTNLANGRSMIVRVNDRGPYANDRVVDLSLAAAKALGFYGQGLTRVRIEYVGRAPLEGSDDRMLLATLRHGAPAPVPSQVRVASARPLLPPPDSGSVSGQRPVPVLGAGTAHPSAPGTGSAERNRQSVVRMPAALGITPSQNPALVSGRGLY